MKYLSVPNLDKHQHYKDRRPPWIKLHASLLQDYEFSLLTDSEKYQIIAIWLLASQLNNKIPDNSSWLCGQIQASKINLRKFKELHMLEDHASNTLAECEQSALVETEAETEAETDTARVETPTESPPQRSICPYQKIISLYHTILPELPQVVDLTDKRKRAISARWKNGMHGLENWDNYFQHVRESKFLMGKVDPPRGRKQFLADIDFLIREATIVSTQEGKYHR